METICIWEVLLGTSQSFEESTDKGIEMAQESIALDKNLAWPHGPLATLYGLKKDFDKALSEGETGLALEPNSALSYMFLGHSLLFSSRYDEAIAPYKKAIRLSPFPPSALLLNLGVCLQSIGGYGEAVAVFKKVLQRWPDHILAHADLAAAYSMMGREKEVREVGAGILRIDPKFSVGYHLNKLSLFFKDPSQNDKAINACRKVGLKQKSDLARSLYKRGENQVKV